jgi:hypothetical protein
MLEANRRIRLTLAALALAAGALSAQEEPPAIQTPNISIAFPGGTLAEFVAQVRKADQGINIVVSALAAEVELPALTLTKTTVDAALRSVGMIVGQDYNVNVQTQHVPGAAPVHSVAVRQIQNPAMATGVAGPGKTVQVFSLRQLTEPVPGDPEQEGLTVPAKTILTAIDTGLGIDGNKDKATIRYHEDSGLVFVQGTHMQASLVAEVLGSMSRDLQARRQAVLNARFQGARTLPAAEQAEPDKPGKREKGEDA